MEGEASLCLLYSFFWVNPWHLNFMCRRLFPLRMEPTKCSKHQHIKFRRRGFTQKKEYNIQNTAEVWNQCVFLIYLIILTEWWNTLRNNYPLFIPSFILVLLPALLPPLFRLSSSLPSVAFLAFLCDGCCQWQSLSSWWWATQFGVVCDCKLWTRRIRPVYVEHHRMCVVLLSEHHVVEDVKEAFMIPDDLSWSQYGHLWCEVVWMDCQKWWSTSVYHLHYIRVNKKIILPVLDLCLYRYNVM